MKGQQGLDLAEDFGAEFTRMMSSAKLVPEQAVRIWGVPESHLREVMAGSAAPSPELEIAINGHAPLNLGDLYSAEARDRFPIRDDTLEGIVVFHGKDSDATRRPLFRTQSSGVKFVVYDYADTAVSRVSESTIIPERIWENIIVDHDSLERVPRWAFNQGHFEQQMTYFMGDVTVYFRDAQERVHPVNMDTGDMEYHVPFVPHLFTKRNHAEGLILAVTYRGEVGTRSFLDSIKDMPEDLYMERVRQALNDIEKSQLSMGDSGFFVNRYDAAPSENQGVYQVKTLLRGVPFQPDTLGLEYTLPAQAGKGEQTMEQHNMGQHDISVDAERWGYVRGESSVTLRWLGHEEVLEPNSSFFIKAGVSHSLRSADEHDGQVVIMQVKPQQEDPWNTLALALHYAGEEGALRARKETKQWTK